jgi:hypothetical protein
MPQIQFAPRKQGNLANEKERFLLTSSPMAVFEDNVY